jgi:hypothetical protein
VAPLPTQAAAIAELAMLFSRNGYVRTPDASHQSQEDAAVRRGYEVRLTAKSVAELDRIQLLLRVTGFKVSRPFAHKRQYRQPLYGRETMRRFMNMIEPWRKAKQVKYP